MSVLTQLVRPQKKKVSNSAMVKIPQKYLILHHITFLKLQLTVKKIFKNTISLQKLGAEIPLDDSLKNHFTT